MRPILKLHSFLLVIILFALVSRAQLFKGEFIFTNLAIFKSYVLIKFWALHFLVKVF